MEVFWGLAIPFIGTTLGSAMVFFMKNKISSKIEKLLLGFASGVMIAASIWSLIIPSLDMAKEQGMIEWLPATVGFMLGIIFLLLIDSLIPHLHLNSDKPEGIKTKLEKTTMMVLAVTIHNLPERNGSWNIICWRVGWKCRNNINGSSCTCNRNSYSKLSRGGNNFNAIKK